MKGRLGLLHKLMSSHEPATRMEWVRSALDRFEGPLTRYAERITGDLHRARDIVQDTFIRLCAEDESKVRDRLAEWLFTVSRNRALDVQRKESRMKPMSDLQMETCASDEPSPSAASEREETNSQVVRAIETLPENQQEVIRLKFQNGLSYKEISRITSLSVSNVGFLIHTGIKTLRQQLQPELGLIRENP